MADEVDRAQAYLEDITSDSEKYIRGQVPTPRDEITDEDRICDQCGCDIGDFRAAKGMTTCIDCQREIEKYRNRLSRHRSRYSDFDD